MYTQKHTLTNSTINRRKHTLNYSTIIRRKHTLNYSTIIRSGECIVALVSSG